MSIAAERLRPTDSLRTIQDAFSSELVKAANAYTNGELNPTSLPFIGNTLPKSPLVQEGVPFQTMVIGGSIAKQAVCLREGDHIQVTHQSEAPLPRFEDARQFLTYIDTSLPEGTTTIALNFAYPITPIFERGRLDGILTAVDPTKALNTPDLIGKKVGEEIENYLATKGKAVTVSVANDGICLLTSGRAEYPKASLAFGIVGTGVNFGFFLDSQTAVNLESAEFDKFPQTSLGRKLAAESGSPFGKEVNGANLYKHFNALANQGTSALPRLSSTEALSALAANKDHPYASAAQQILDRSAQLVACQVAGIAEFVNQDMVFVMEGSLFWKGHAYKSTVEDTVATLTTRTVSFVEVTNSGILGAAKLVS